MKQGTVPPTPRRHDRLIRERVHDPYKMRDKLPEPTVCPDCGAVWHAGRWTWMDHRPEGAEEHRCQACHRIADEYPAGELVIAGEFAKTHADEIRGLVRNQEGLEKGERPLHRIMTIVEDDRGILVTTTDIHLPRRIGEALHSAYEGDLDFKYDEEGYFIRVEWRRDT